MIYFQIAVRGGYMQYDCVANLQELIKFRSNFYKHQEELF